jgi:hypothetical protein
MIVIFFGEFFLASNESYEGRILKEYGPVTE